MFVKLSVLAPLFVTYVSALYIAAPPSGYVGQDSFPVSIAREDGDPDYVDLILQSLSSGTRHYVTPSNVRVPDQLSEVDVAIPTAIPPGKYQFIATYPDNLYGPTLGHSEPVFFGY